MFRPDNEVPEDQRFQIIELPHGPLIDIKLLDAVDEKLRDTYDTKSRCNMEGLGVTRAAVPA